MTSPTPEADVPRPMPFAVMRNAHEALRASIRLQAQHLEAMDVAAFRAEWNDCARALHVHMAMEDQAVFPLLDEVGNGAITTARLPAQHLEDARLLQRVESLLDSGDHAALRQAWSVWRDDHLHHLEHEEQVMVPLTLKTGGTPQARARAMHERVLVPSEALPDFDWFIGWVVHKLSHEGSSGQTALTATRVFAWGLQHACSSAQWQRLRPIVQAHCGPDIWSALVRDFGLDGEGGIA